MAYVARKTRTRYVIGVGKKGCQERRRIRLTAPARGSRITAAIGFSQGKP